MKSFFLIALLFMKSSALALEARFYLGTYTNTGLSKGIYTTTLDLETGKLGRIELAAETTNPSYLALNPGGQFLYAAGEGTQGLVTAFRVEPNGQLVYLNEKDSGGSGACHVCVDVGSQNVFVANYSTGDIAGFQIKPDGSLGERTAYVQFTDHKKSHAHSVDIDSTNRFLYSCDLGTDTIWIFQSDAQTGRITPNNPPAAKAPSGAGPRHLAFHPSARFAYVNNEMGCTVSVFNRDISTGELSPLQVVSTLPDGVSSKGTTTAEIVCHPTGKWLYVSNRGEDTIPTFAIATDGKLTSISNGAAGVKGPRGFAIDPTGHWLIAAGQNDNRITVLKINQTTGELSPTDQFAQVGSPVCVIFAPAK